MNIMRVHYRDPGPQEHEDFVFHKYTLLETARKALASRGRTVKSIEFSSGLNLTEKEVAEAMMDGRFLGS